MRVKISGSVGLVVAGGLMLAAGALPNLTSTASAAGPPPAPTAVNGHPVATVATGVATPTSFAFDTAHKTTFIGAYGDPERGKGGGVLALSRGESAKRVPGIPSRVAGLAFHKGTLYVSTNGAKAGRIMSFTGWNGTRFAAAKTVFHARGTVGAVNGIAWGPDGRLYGGSGLTADIQRNGKVKKVPFPHPYTVFSIKPNGSDFRVVARGLRQPWQLTFASGSRDPYVSVLSQEAGRIPPDAIVEAKRGQDYGFPKCFAGVGSACRHTSFASPLILLPRHASPMGIQAVGHTLYVALFGGVGHSGPEIVTIPAKHNGKPKPFLTGFAAPVVALGISHGTAYAGDLTGSIYRVAL